MTMFWSTQVKPASSGFAGNVRAFALDHVKRIEEYDGKTVAVFEDGEGMIIPAEDVERFIVAMQIDETPSIFGSLNLSLGMLDDDQLAFLTQEAIKILVRRHALSADDVFTVADALDTFRASAEQEDRE